MSENVPRCCLLCLEPRDSHTSSMSIMLFSLHNWDMDVMSGGIPSTDTQITTFGW